MTHPDILLGREVAYPDRYDPGLLFPIPRAQGRLMQTYNVGGKPRHT